MMDLCLQPHCQSLVREGQAVRVNLQLFSLSARQYLAHPVEGAAGCNQHNQSPVSGSSMYSEEMDAAVSEPDPDMCSGCFSDAGALSSRFTSWGQRSASETDSFLTAPSFVSNRLSDLANGAPSLGETAHEEIHLDHAGPSTGFGHETAASTACESHCFASAP